MSEKLPDRTIDDPAALSGDVYVQRFSVPFEYPVHFTRRVFHPRNALLADVLDRLGEGRRHRAAVFVDQGLADANGLLVNQVKEYFHEHPAQMELAGAVNLLPGGPAVKSDYGAVREVLWTIGNLHLDRQSFVIAVGGGSLLDTVGFAASVAHRGLRLIRVPSTTLAQNDAGVGVKNGMDEHGQKNFLGTFAPPFAVVCDFDLLRTLPWEHWIAGAAEAFKVAVIKDAEFLDFLCTHAKDLRGRDESVMEQLVRRCAVLHLEHIRTGGDPFEFGSARPLDFGHWAAHRLEVLSGRRLSHGQAVAVGIALDTTYAAGRGMIAPAERDRVLDAMDACGLPTWTATLAVRTDEGELAVLEGIEQFREHLGGRLNVTLPAGLGHKTEVHHMDAAGIGAAVEFLARRAPTRETP
ncbi:MAG TPA: 3-dehydroquinate synthase [Phycisphaerales bacterium]|nr:3-dehydroquinate synthase [Phycisphaerales bacterium]